MPTNILNTKPLLLESHSCNFPEDIIIKINNILCEEYIKLIFDSLQNNFIKNIIYIFLNDKKLSKFVYYFAFQKYRYIYILDGVYGETLNNLGWEHFETDILYEETIQICYSCCLSTIFSAIFFCSILLYFS